MTSLFANKPFYNVDIFLKEGIKWCVGLNRVKKEFNWKGCFFIIRERDPKWNAHLFQFYLIKKSKCYILTINYKIIILEKITFWGIMLMTKK